MQEDSLPLVRSHLFQLLIEFIVPHTPHLIINLSSLHSNDCAGGKRPLEIL